MSMKILWYGRCCFLVELDSTRILFDPYDRYCNVDIGIIDADMLISSSTWHDHGHIGASPNAWIFTYPGKEEHSGFTITGIEAKENRGTPTVIFNLRTEFVSITNFADLGAANSAEFDNNLTNEQRDILQSTNIAFIRPSIESDEIQETNVHNETALKYCQPNIILPEHYFPEAFIKEQVPISKQKDFMLPNKIVDEMLELFSYPVDIIDSYEITLAIDDVANMRKLYKLLRLHPQVTYK